MPHTRQEHSGIFRARNWTDKKRAMTSRDSKTRPPAEHSRQKKESTMNHITKQAIWLLTVVMASLLLCTASPVLAVAADPAIAFTTSDSRSNYLMVMNADGTNQKALLTVSKKAN